MSFEAYLGFTGDSAAVHLSGDLTEVDVPVLRSLIDQALGRGARQLVLEADALRSIVAGGARCLAFAQQRLPEPGHIVVRGAREPVRRTLAQAGIEEALTLVDSRVAEGD
ncbi:STAS domain-containing protein [Streptomyces sp. 3MP-14]|uniref:STAS domain-containing protein n=1 Tax=Streptomyces mimosae TaxID=2586635 RepID=A0A5N6APN5_9ACTN|nr:MULTISPECIES: STAS domain-containing protein [Streptomyces]KAB8169649.1 STAS domain-containing protein [Streptomyces mimosae]KAB8178397.1 STAS domain-containing protein [Streptomyces sp. 3MP-14]